MPRQLFVDGLHGFPGLGAIPVGTQVEDHHRQYDQKREENGCHRQPRRHDQGDRNACDHRESRHDELQEQRGPGRQFLDLSGDRLAQLRATSGRKVLPAGTLAPDFRLRTTPDQYVSLSDFRGQPVILAFYPADWSPVCGDQLALWQGTAEMLDRLLTHAKEVGLRPFAMIRLQAQLRSAEENIPEASALWNQVIKHEEATSKDFLAGAFAALKNNQSLEAFRIASNGLDRFEHEASYANDAGWLLLQFSLPAEALDLLDRKKERPTADDAIQMRYILTICAADQSTQTKRADETFKEYATLYPTIIEEEVIRGFNLPELLTGTLISVARRNP